MPVFCNSLKYPLLAGFIVLESIEEYNFASCIFVICTNVDLLHDYSFSVHRNFELGFVLSCDVGCFLFGLCIILDT